MHRCCFKITSATNVTTILACLNLIKRNQMLNSANWYKKTWTDEKAAYLAEKAKYHASSKYQEEILRSIKLIIGPGKKSSFLQLHLLQIYVKRLCQISVLILLLRCLKKLVVQFVENWLQFVKWRNCLMLKNISLLKVDGVTRKARSNSSDLVKELRGPILAPGCSSVCFTCVDFLQKEKYQFLLLQMASGLERSQMNYKNWLMQNSYWLPKFAIIGV